MYRNYNIQDETLTNNPRQFLIQGVDCSPPATLVFFSFIFLGFLLSQPHPSPPLPSPPLAAAVPRPAAVTPARPPRRKAIRIESLKGLTLSGIRGMAFYEVRRSHRPSCNRLLCTPLHTRHTRNSFRLFFIQSKFLAPARAFGDQRLKSPTAG